MMYIEKLPWREGAHHQTAERRTATPRSQAGAAQETTTEPDPEGEHSTEGKTPRRGKRLMFIYHV